MARPKPRVALRATRLAAAVAKNGYFDPNVAPAQLLIKCPGISLGRLRLTVSNTKGGKHEDRLDTYVR